MRGSVKKNYYDKWEEHFERFACKIKLNYIYLYNLDLSLEISNYLWDKGNNNNNTTVLYSKIFMESCTPSKLFVIYHNRRKWNQRKQANKQTKAVSGPGPTTPFFRILSWCYVVNFNFFYYNVNSITAPIRLEHGNGGLSVCLWKLNMLSCLIYKWQHFSYLHTQTERKKEPPPTKQGTKLKKRKPKRHICVNITVKSGSNHWQRRRQL